MKYLSYICESKNVEETVTSKEALINNAAAIIADANLTFESFIYDNLNSFIGENINDTYQNIKSYIINENISLYNELVSDLLSENAILNSVGHVLKGAASTLNPMNTGHVNVEGGKNLVTHGLQAAGKAGFLGTTGFGAHKLIGAYDDLEQTQRANQEIGKTGDLSKFKDSNLHTTRVLATQFGHASKNLIAASKETLARKLES